MSCQSRHIFLGLSKLEQRTELYIILKKMLKTNMINGEIFRFYTLLEKKLFKIKFCKCPASNKILSHIHSVVG
jgi:hypothetical protein